MGGGDRREELQRLGTDPAERARIFAEEFDLVLQEILYRLVEVVEDLLAGLVAEAKRDRGESWLPADLNDAAGEGLSDLEVGAGPVVLDPDGIARRDEIAEHDVFPGDRLIHVVEAERGVAQAGKKLALFVAERVALGCEEGIDR